MASFDYVLPSNTSSKLYPHNSASDYTTVPHNPLELQGSWEVGVKSAFYSSHIGDVNEKGHVKLTYEKHSTVNINGLYPVEYKVTKHKWNYQWRTVPPMDVSLPESHSHEAYRLSSDSAFKSMARRG